MDIVNLEGKNLGNVRQSAISDQLMECNCSIDFGSYDM